MKSIKKISLLALAAVLSFGFANAQVGITAGYSTSTQETTISIPKSMQGFHVGLDANLDIQGPVSLQYGLLYNYLTSSKDIIGSLAVKTEAHRLDLPVRVKISIPLGNSLKLYAFGGPNFNYALSQQDDITKTNIYKELGGTKYYKPFDVQLGAGAGLQHNKIGVRVSYDWGMLDRYTPEVSEWKNNDLKASLVYSF